MKPLIAGVVPVKPLADSKSRLADVLDADGRAALSLMLLHHVLRTGRRAPDVGHWYVVGGDEYVELLAGQQGAEWVADPDRDLNDAVRSGTAIALDNGAHGVLVLPADLAFLTADEVTGLVRASRNLAKVVIAMAPKDGGTNALLAPRGSLAGPYFGPDSFRLHVEAMREAGIPYVAVEFPGVSFDLDTPDDLAYYRARRPGLDAEIEAWKARIEGWKPLIARRTEKEST